LTKTLLKFSVHEKKLRQIKQTQKERTQD